MPVVVNTNIKEENKQVDINFLKNQSIKAHQ